MPQEDEVKQEDTTEEEKEMTPTNPTYNLEKLCEIPSDYSIRNIVWEEEEEQQVNFEGYGMDASPSGAQEEGSEEKETAEEKEKKEPLMKLIAADLSGFSYWDLENSLLKGNEDPLLRVGRLALIVSDRSVERRTELETICAESSERSKLETSSVVCALKQHLVL